MQHLLNLFAAIALLVWGTHIVRAGVLRVFGEGLRGVLERSVNNRFSALLAGLTVTGFVQSSTATSLIASSFVGRGLIATSAALAVMLGADVGNGVMVVVFSFDLSWLSPLLIFFGVLLFLSREKTLVGHVGRVFIGLGLITLALQLIIAATRPLTESPVVQQLLVALPHEVLLDVLVGAMLTVMAYSSLAIVLLTATLCASGLVPLTVAFGLVLGANLGSGVLAVIATTRAELPARRVPLGNLAFKAIGCAIVIPLLPYLRPWLPQWVPGAHHQVVLFHLAFNLLLALLFIGLTGQMARWLERWLVAPPPPPSSSPRHLDPVALATPSLAISCAAREALRQADVVETMLLGVLPVMRNNDLELSAQLRAMDDTVDELYAAIKFYLTQISRQALSERESRRWTDILSFAINMEQIADIVERVLLDLEEKKIRKNRSFSDAGMAELCHLHEILIGNLRLAMSVFLDGHVRDATKLLEENARLRDLERQYAANHLARLQDNTRQSIETSSLHLDLIAELKRIGSHLCSVAYPILESTGALTPTRLRPAAPHRAPKAGADVG